MTQIVTVAEQHKQKGNECFDRQNFEEALYHYTEAIKLDPNNHIYYSNRSSCYYHLKNYECALKDAYKSFELCPSWSKVVPFIFWQDRFYELCLIISKNRGISKQLWFYWN
jgi:tetratricopeptide (TPR) repeat protein